MGHFALGTLCQNDLQIVFETNLQDQHIVRNAEYPNPKMLNLTPKSKIVQCLDIILFGLTHFDTLPHYNIHLSNFLTLGYDGLDPLAPPASHALDGQIHKGN